MRKRSLISTKKMDINQKLADGIIKQLKDIYPDTIPDTTQILPEEKDVEKREEIKKTVLILRNQGKIALKEGRGIHALSFNIRFIKQ